MTIIKPIIYEVQGQQVKSWWRILNKLNDLDYIKNIGNQHYYGRINFENSYSDSQIVLSNYDDIEWKEDILPTIASFEGNYPTKKNEIALSRWTLNKLGYKNKKIGDYITLNINHQKQRFNISAIFTDYLIGRDQKTKSANVAAATFYFKDHANIFSQKKLPTLHETASLFLKYFI